MNSAWDIVSTGNGFKAAWKCMECGRVVIKAGEPSAWQHLQTCRHSPHQPETDVHTDCGGFAAKEKP